MSTSSSSSRVCIIARFHFSFVLSLFFVIFPSSFLSFSFFSFSARSLGSCKVAASYVLCLRRVESTWFFASGGLPISAISKSGFGVFERCNSTRSLTQIPYCNLSTVVNTREVLSIRRECEPADSSVINHPFLAYSSIRIPENDGAIP